MFDTILGEEAVLNLVKDGGRHVMHGGNPYEDDLEAADWDAPTEIFPGRTE